MRRLLPLVSLMLVVAGLVGACGGDDDSENASKACGPAPTTAPGGVTLPTGFPVPSQVTMVSATKTGPSTVLEGYTTADMDDAYNNYKQALGTAPFTVTKSEKEDDDAEVNFESADSTGQVKLKEECQDRTSVTITVRPK